LPPEKRKIVELIPFLAPTIGEEKAKEVIGETAKKLGFSEEISKEEGLQILEKITEMGGLVGITARFAKAQVHLHW